MMKLISEYKTIEITWNYEYETKERFEAHEYEMKSQGIFPVVVYECNNGKVIATYTDREVVKGEHL